MTGRIGRATSEIEKRATTSHRKCRIARARRWNRWAGSRSRLSHVHWLSGSRAGPAARSDRCVCYRVSAGRTRPAKRRRASALNERSHNWARSAVRDPRYAFGTRRFRNAHYQSRLLRCGRIQERPLRLSPRSAGPDRFLVCRRTETRHSTGRTFRRGKTTVLNLILRLYDGYEGSILVDGQEIREFNRVS